MGYVYTRLWQTLELRRHLPHFAIKVPLKGVDKDGMSVVHRDVPSKLFAQRCDAPVRNSARHNVVEPLEVSVAVDGYAVRRDVPASVDT